MTRRPGLWSNAANSLRLKFLQELSRCFGIELLVRGFDAEEKAVICYPGELSVAKQRMIGFWQAVEEKHAKYRTRGRKENRHLKRHGDECRPAVQRSPTDIVGVFDN